MAPLSLLYRLIAWSQGKRELVDDMLKRIGGFIVDCVIAVVVYVITWLVAMMVSGGKDVLSVFIATAFALLLLFALQTCRRKKRKEEGLYAQMQRKTPRSAAAKVEKHNVRQSKPTASKPQDTKPVRHAVITNITRSGTNNYTVWGDLYDGEQVVRHNTHMGGVVRNGELMGWAQDFFVIADEKGQVWSFDATGQLLGSLKFNPDSWQFGNVGGPGFTLRARASQYTVRKFNKYCK